MADTLVLDRNWQPVGFTNWQNAVKLRWEGVAEVIREDEGGKILHSPSFTWKMPRVIVVKNAWQRRKREEVPFSRRNLAIRDNSECQFCGKVLHTHEYTFDHVIPQCRGGQSTWENLVLACARCNNYKSDMSLAESGMHLLQKPVRPKPHDPTFNFKLHVRHIRPEWKEWQNWLYAEKASWSYWNVELEP